MSTGRIDVIAVPSDKGINVSLESFESLVGDGSGGAIWNAHLTFDEARYLVDELQFAIEGHQRASLDAWKAQQDPRVT